MSSITDKFCKKKKISESIAEEEIVWKQKPSGNGSIHRVMCLGISFKLYSTIQSIAKEYSYDWKEIESK